MIGTKVHLSITDQGDGGEGIGNHEGLVVFVQGAVLGDEVLVEVIEHKKNYAIAKLLEIAKPSANRVEPPCEYFYHCGGCQIMDLSYDAQLRLKEKKVKDALQRIGGIHVRVNPILGMEEPYFYRNKTIYPVLHHKVGIFKPRSHEIVQVKKCLIHHPKGDKVLEVVREHLKKSLSGYDEQTHRGSLRHVMFRSHGDEHMVVLVIHEEADLTLLVEDLKAIGIQHVIKNVNHRKGNVILGSENQVLHGTMQLMAKLGNLSFLLSAQSFFQVNTAQTLVLYDEVKRLAKLTGEEVVLDLYAGMGTIGSYLSSEAREVIAVEVVGEAVQDGIKSAEANGIDNMRFIHGDAAEGAKRLREEGTQVDVVVVDPPRKGLEPSLIEIIQDFETNKIIYVSCKPSSLARDLKLFKEKGWEVQEVQPVDLFPHTTHVETVVLMCASS